MKEKQSIMKSKEFGNTKPNEVLEKCPAFTDDQKAKLNELIEKGWFDVVQPYMASCARRSFAEFVLSRKIKWKIYKDDQMYSKDQEEKITKLFEMKWWDVLKAYRKACEEENYTEEYKAALLLGRIEGVGMDDDLD